MVRPPPRGAVCSNHERYPAFALCTLLLLPAPQKWQLGFWVFFSILLFITHSNSACTQLVLVPYSLVPYSSVPCKHCSPGSQVPAHDILPSSIKVQLLVVCVCVEDGVSVKFVDHQIRGPDTQKRLEKCCQFSRHILSCP